MKNIIKSWKTHRSSCTPNLIKILAFPTSGKSYLETLLENDERFLVIDSDRYGGKEVNALQFNGAAHSSPQSESEAIFHYALGVSHSLAHMHPSKIVVFLTNLWPHSFTTKALFDIAVVPLNFRTVIKRMEDRQTRMTGEFWKEWHTSALRDYPASAQHAFYLDDDRYLSHLFLDMPLVLSRVRGLPSVYSSHGMDYYHTYSVE
jgi:hypothetical protein